MMTNKLLKIFSRTALTALLAYEFLNLSGVFHHRLDFTWFGLIITLTAIWLGLEAALYYTKTAAKSIGGIALLTAAAALYIDAMGDILGFYGKFSWYDQLAHFFGGLAAGSIVFLILKTCRIKSLVEMNIYLKSFFALTFASFLGMFYELEEYLEDFFTGSNRLGSGPDTANDLMLNLFGSLLIVSTILINSRRQKNKKECA